MTNIKPPKNPKILYCENCNFKCINKKDYNRHLNTAKHQILSNTIEKPQKTPKPLSYICDCGKEYKHNSSLWNHKKKCNYVDSELIDNTPPNTMIDSSLVI